MSATLLLDYMPLEQLAHRSADWWSRVLGVVGFDGSPRIEQQQVPVTASMTPMLGGEAGLCEVWRVADGDALQPEDAAGVGGRLRYRHCDQLLFGCVNVVEQDLLYAGENNPSAALQRATRTAYQDMFALLNTTGHAHLIRVWNYLPEINGHSDGEERYRHFNSARASAFAQSGREDVASVPAASALGSGARSPLSIYFLAARHTPVMIENPRQISAYRYPPQYGSHSPLFSRACVTSSPGGTNLFVSGTASIVGHETIHRGNVVAQTRETLCNITALLEEANRRTRPSRYTLDSLQYKVYIRDPSDQPAVAAELAATLQTSTRVVYLQADVCRNDLLVEIEASGESMHAPSQWS